jgi:hypothetical protein
MARSQTGDTTAPDAPIDELAARAYHRSLAAADPDSTVDADEARDAAAQLLDALE